MLPTATYPGEKYLSLLAAIGLGKTGCLPIFILYFNLTTLFKYRYYHLLTSRVHLDPPGFTFIPVSQLLKYLLYLLNAYWALEMQRDIRPILTWTLKERELIPLPGLQWESEEGREGKDGRLSHFALQTSELCDT